MTRDEFLTRKMGVCWHVFTPSERDFCIRCDRKTGWLQEFDFSTPNGFFDLWNWAKEQEWWGDFVTEYTFKGEDHIVSFAFGVSRTFDLIEPDKLANAIYEFLEKYDAR